MTTTPEIPVQSPEAPKIPEAQGEIPVAVEQGQPIVQQSTQPTPRPVAAPTAGNSTAAPSAPTVTIPADPAQLTQLAKGNPVNAITWFANFWLRVIKKALSLGSNIMTSQSVNTPVASPASANTAASGNATSAIQTVSSTSDDNSAATTVSNNTSSVDPTTVVQEQSTIGLKTDGLETQTPLASSTK